tara:strand:+ start:123 stop:641 length:519 start_codon:yes stop_codon:yes gene_type:complete
VEFLSVGSEYFINSQELEDKVRNLLPSQGGAGAGFDLSASTQIVPIIDLTESAEGSNVRADLQTALSFSTATFTSTDNSTNTIISNTGYYRIFGNSHLTGAGQCIIQANDGASIKVLNVNYGIDDQLSNVTFDFIVFVPAGVTIEARTNTTDCVLSTTTRQIADIDGNLTNP